MKIRKKMWLISISMLLVLGLPLAYVGAKYVLAQRVLLWKAQGIAAAKAGDQSKASELLLRYLQRRPGDIEALTIYIQAREAAELPGGQNLAETIAALKLLLSQEPDRVDDRLHLLTLYSRLEQRPEAVDAANAILKTIDPRLAKGPKDAHLLALKLMTLKTESDVLIRMGRHRDALKVIDQLLEITPDDLQANLSRVTLRKRLGNSADLVVGEIVKLLDAHKNDPRYELLLGIAEEKRDYVEEKDGDDVKAARLLNDAAGRPNLSDDVAIALVGEFDYLGKSDESIEVLQRLVKNGATGEIRNALGRRYWERGRWQEAADTLANVDPQGPTSDPTLIALKAFSLAGIGHKEEADACRAALISRDRAAARAWALILERVVDAGTPDDKRICAEVRSSLASDGSNPYLDYYYGDSCMRLGEIDLGIIAWQRVFVTDQAWLTPGLRLVDALIQRNRTAEAMVVALQNKRRDTTTEGATHAGTIITLVRAWSRELEGNSATREDLLKLVTDIQSKLPGEQQTLLIQVQLLAQQQQKDQAAKIIRSVLTQSPPPTSQLLLILATVSRKYTLGVHEECYARCEQLYGLTPELGYGRAVDSLISGKPKVGLQEFDDVAKRSGHSTELNWQLMRARYLDISGDGDARTAWIALGDANPQNLEVQRAVAAGRAVRTVWDLQLRTIDRLQKLGESKGYRGLEWQLARARLYVEAPRSEHAEDDNQQGAKFCRDLIQECGTSLSEPYVLLAQALVRMNRIDGAIEKLNIAAKIDPFSASIALQLAGLYRSTGNLDRAGQEVDRVAPQLHTTDECRQAAVLYAAQGKPDKAVALLENSSAAAGGAPDLVLAALYTQQRQYDKAELIVHKLLERPDVSSVQFAASFFASIGRRPDAEQALAKLDGLDLAPGIRELIRGKCLGEMGDIALARKEFESVTQNAPANADGWRYLAVCQLTANDLAAFEATLASAGKAAAKDPDEPGDRPSRMMRLASNAALLRKSAEADDVHLRQVVLTVVREQNSVDAGIELLKLAADAMANGDREQYAARLQQLVEKYPAALPVRTELISCYGAMNRPDDALAAARQAMTALPGTPEPPRLAVGIALAGGRWTDAREMAEAWKRRASDAAVTADIMFAQADLALKDYSGALQRLQPYLAAAKSDPERYADMITAYCIVASNAGQRSVPDELMWSLVRSSAVWQQRWIQVAVATQDLQQAVASLDRLEAILPATAERQRTMLADAYEQVGRRPNPAKDNQIAKVEDELIARSVRELQGLAQRPDASAVTLVSAASQAERLQHFEIAEAYYRRALSLEPKMWSAQNNLAVLIATRGGDLNEALTLATTAAKLQGRQPAVFDTLADVQARIGDFTTAGDTVRQAIRLAPDDAKWRIRLARYLVKSGKIAEAAKTIAVVTERRLDAKGLSPQVQQELTEVRKLIQQGSAG